MVEPYKLIHPVTVDDRQVMEIPLRRGTLGDLIALEKGPQGEMEQTAFLIQRMSGLKRNVIEAITGEDIVKLANVLPELLGNGGEKTSEEGDGESSS